MQLHSSEPIVHVPVSLSVVVICDLRVLVNTGEGVHFPYCYFSGQSEKACYGSIEAKAWDLVRSLVEGKYDISNWLPVDVRSRVDRLNVDGQYSLDIGMLAIMDAVDIPVSENGYKWELVNLEETKFPVELLSDHAALWQSAREMFNIMK